MRILDNNEVAQVSGGGGGLLGLNLNLLDLVGIDARVGFGRDDDRRGGRCHDRGRRGRRHHNRGRHCW